jgi:hypothetical protein
VVWALVLSDWAYFIMSNLLLTYHLSCIGMNYVVTNIATKKSGPTVTLRFSCFFSLFAFSTNCLYVSTHTNQLPSACKWTAIFLILGKLFSEFVIISNFLKLDKRISVVCRLFWNLARVMNSPRDQTFLTLEHDPSCIPKQELFPKTVFLISFSVIS